DRVGHSPDLTVRSPQDGRAAARARPVRHPIKLETLLLGDVFPMSRYPDLPASPGELEEQVLAQWSAEDTFAKSLAQTADCEPFVFFEGPPTANGRPGIHHVLSRTIKDTVAR